MKTGANLCNYKVKYCCTLEYQVLDCSYSSHLAIRLFLRQMEGLGAQCLFSVDRGDGF